MNLRILASAMACAGIAVSAMAGTLFAESADDLVGIARAARPSVLHLQMFDDRGATIGSATGFVVSADGKVVTNYRMVEKASKIIAQSENGAFYRSEGLLASDPANDVALIKLEATGLPPLTLGSSRLLELGTKILVLGNSKGSGNALSEGVVSAKREVGGILLIHITAPIPPGLSGAPVLTLSGQVAGVAKSIYQPASSQNLSFTAPAEIASELLAKSAGQNPMPFAGSRTSAATAPASTVATIVSGPLSCVVPDSLFTSVQRAPDASRVTCLSADGRTKLLLAVLQGEKARMPMNKLFDEYAREHTKADPGKKVDYKTFKDSWFVVSGTDGPRGFYIKVKRKGNLTLFFGLEYDESAKDITGANLTAMARSFCPD